MSVGEMTNAVNELATHQKCLDRLEHLAFAAPITTPAASIKQKGKPSTRRDDLVGHRQLASLLQALPVGTELTRALSGLQVVALAVGAVRRTLGIDLLQYHGVPTLASKFRGVQGLQTRSGTASGIPLPVVTGLQSEAFQRLTQFASSMTAIRSRLGIDLFQAGAGESLRRLLAQSAARQRERLVDRQTWSPSARVGLERLSLMGRTLELSRQHLGIDLLGPNAAGQVQRLNGTIAAIGSSLTPGALPALPTMAGAVVTPKALSFVGQTLGVDFGRPGAAAALRQRVDVLRANDPCGAIQAVGADAWSRSSSESVAPAIDQLQQVTRIDLRRHDAGLNVAGLVDRLRGRNLTESLAEVTFSPQLLSRLAYLARACEALSPP